MTPAAGYMEMKDSGIGWVGEIPKEWNINVLFQLVSQVKNKNKDLVETNLLSLSYGKIKRKNIDHTDGLIPASFDGYNIIEDGDIVLRLTDLQNDQTSLRVGRATERGIITSAYTTLRPVNFKTSKFIYYLLHAFDIRKGFYGMGAGVRQGLNYDEVKVLKLPIPPQEEQTVIVAYLDSQCAKIDEIIAEAKASIEDYKQWKASIIYEAVTKGLDPNAEMKDSGIEWIGEIPKGWEIKKAKKCVTITNGADPKTEGNIPVYGSGAESFKTCGEYKEGPTVLIGRKGATLHIPHYITGRYWNVDTAFDVKAKAGFSLKYYYYLAYSFDYKYYISQTTLPSMTQTNYNNILLPVPPKETQDLISRVLSTRIEKIDAYIDEKKSLVTDLESYKKSLIYEAVTGKKRVC